MAYKCSITSIKAEASLPYRLEISLIGVECSEKSFSLYFVTAVLLKRTLGNKNIHLLHDLAAKLRK